MDSTEALETRISMVSMHSFFIQRINSAIDSKLYIEASWLIYACMENRFYRLLAKIKQYCRFDKSKCRDVKNVLALSTKIKCVKRLCEEHVSCIEANFDPCLFDRLLVWVKKRNELIHDLVNLENYRDMDDEFSTLANEGKSLLDELYDSCTGFRASFYSDGYVFEFPEKAMGGCSCKPRKEKRAD